MPGKKASRAPGRGVSVLNVQNFLQKIGILRKVSYLCRVTTKYRGFAPATILTLVPLSRSILMLMTI